MSPVNGAIQEGSDAVITPDTARWLRPAAAQVRWAVVPAGRWQSARPVGGAPVLVAYVVAPGFDGADFNLLPAAD
ncbi:cupin domain-containing protein [Streptomyces sp. NPDC002867]